VSPGLLDPPTSQTGKQLHIHQPAGRAEVRVDLALGVVGQPAVDLAGRAEQGIIACHGAILRQERQSPPELRR
jgi:hypothetical protein